jgi:hypothetical protein
LRPNVNALFSLLLDKAQTWRRDDFPHEKFPTVGEILKWASEPDRAGFRLRSPLWRRDRELINPQSL